MRLYRLAYNAIAVVSFFPILWMYISLPNRTIFAAPAPLRGLLVVGQASTAVLLLASLLQTDALAFIGLRPEGTSSAPSRLVTSGSYRYVRHPLYALGLLILWLSPVISQNSVTINVLLAAYILIGIQFEERRLVNEYGAEYEAYRRKTGMLIPYVKLKLH
jgi:protein-S-isoprenylcysteine O-methyltransferase Ste14